MFIIGIDPGADGAATLSRPDRSIDVFRFKNKTKMDILECFEEWQTEWTDNRMCLCYLEKVHSMPGQGVSSTFKFGKGWGVLIGLLTALRIPYELVTPNKWQKYLGCQSKGDKNATKNKAQQLFPNIKIVHGNADSILIAEYGKRLLND